MDIHSSQLSSENVTIAQVCFIVKELLGMFENQSSESFVRDLIHLLPKICTKLQKIIADLREHDSAHEKEAAKLLLCLLITIFSWKEFQTARYNTLLRGMYIIQFSVIVCGRKFVFSVQNAFSFRKWYFPHCKRVGKCGFLHTIIKNTVCNLCALFLRLFQNILFIIASTD